MEQHDLIPGSEAWKQFRLDHFPASEAPVMLGISPYKTRSQLLHEMHTRIAPEVDDSLQRRFEDGHRFEALARPLAEQIIGQRLFPVVASEGKLSASFDGLTMDDLICWEHKTANTVLLESLRNKIIPEQYHPQMEQQLMISGAERCLFSATKWAGDILVEEEHCWYAPNPELRRSIMQGWTQFAIDLESYVPPVTVEKPLADAIMQLPALFVHARVEITDSNMEEFGEALAASLARTRAIQLVTDQDFSNAEAAAKTYRETGKKLMLAKDAMLAQTLTIGAAANMMDAWYEDLRITALKLEKDVEREKEAKKLAILNTARTSFADHVSALQDEIIVVRLSMLLKTPDFATAMKGKRLVSAWHDAVSTALANAKIEADSVAKDVRSKISWCKKEAAGMSMLFPDLQGLIGMDFDAFTAVIKNRINEHKQAEAEKIERIRAQEQVKAEAAARAKVEAEAKERERIHTEQQTKAQAAVEVQRAKQQVSESEPQAGQDQVPKSQSSPPVLLTMSPAVAQNLARAKAIVKGRPSDEEIITALAQHFLVPHATVIDWLLNLNASVVRESLAVNLGEVACR